MSRYYLLLVFASLFLYTACEDDGPSERVLPAYDRQGLLAGWVDNAYIPAHQNFATSLEALATSNESFQAAPSQTSLTILQASFKDAYLAFQRLDPFILGAGESLRMRDLVNTYPTDTDLILTNVAASNVNLELPSNTLAQGLPAMEFLLHANGDNMIADENYRNYFTQLISRIQGLNDATLEDWQNTNRAVYVQNDGNSATASIDRTVNDFIFYYEKFLRAGKVGIPAGIFSDDPLPDRAEARYGGYSKELLIEAITTFHDFFNDGGLKMYLDAMEENPNGEPLSTTINNQFEVILEQANGQPIVDNFETLASTDIVSMLRLYDEMQKIVVLIKVDMLQVLNVDVDFVDADGD